MMQVSSLWQVVFLGFLSIPSTLAATASLPLEAQQRFLEIIAEKDKKIANQANEISALNGQMQKCKTAQRQHCEADKADQQQQCEADKANALKRQAAELRKQLTQARQDSGLEAKISACETQLGKAKETINAYKAKQTVAKPVPVEKPQKKPQEPSKAKSKPQPPTAKPCPNCQRHPPKPNPPPPPTPLKAFQ